MNDVTKVKVALTASLFSVVVSVGGFAITATHAARASMPVVATSDAGTSTRSMAKDIADALSAGKSIEPTNLRKHSGARY